MAPAQDRADSVAQVAAIGDEAGRATISVVVPARNADPTLARCLAALRAEADARIEIIVVDDGSTDATAQVAVAAGVRLLRCRPSIGPGPARNHGARHAAADVVVFVDADVEIAPGSLDLIRQAFGDPRVTALFGSYDATPSETNLVSRYRNLLHHYVHQRGRQAASHFWSGLGAVRRDVFMSLGGFDEEQYARACEDIEFGYRLRSHGHDIRLHKRLQGKHLKRWTLRSMTRTDFLLRAAPWMRLLLERGLAPDDLSLSWLNRLSVALAGSIPLLLAASLAWPGAVLTAGAAVLAFAAINLPLFAFLAQRHGLAFALLCLPLHLLHNIIASAGALYGLAQVGASQVARPAPAASGKT